MKIFKISYTPYPVTADNNSLSTKQYLIILFSH